MSKSGFLVRFVDVVLILLFGFIAISELREQSRIELPESTETPVSMPESVRQLYVGILPDGSYLVDGESLILKSPYELRAWLMKQAGQAPPGSLRIRIRSNYDTPIRYVMYAAQLCDGLSLEKAIDVRLAPAGRN